MKKFINYFAICLLALCMASCSWFDSEPIEPDIIGVGHIKFNSQSNLYVVELDTVSYIVDKVVERDRNIRSVDKTQNLPPVDGMEVTVFRDKNGHIVCVYGRKDEAQIEELYHTNSTAFFVIVVFAFVGMIIILLPTKKKQKS